MIQQMILFLSATLMLPVFGIWPDSSWNFIWDFSLNIFEWSVNAPPELTLPVAWQLELIAQVELMMGCTSVANFGEIPVQGSVTAGLFFVQQGKRQLVTRIK